jgi:hypothetical protein
MKCQTHRLTFKIALIEANGSKSWVFFKGAGIIIFHGCKMSELQR